MKSDMQNTTKCRQPEKIMKKININLQHVRVKVRGFSYVEQNDTNMGMMHLTLLMLIGQQETCNLNLPKCPFRENSDKTRPPQVGAVASRGDLRRFSPSSSVQQYC